MFCSVVAGNKNLIIIFGKKAIDEHWEVVDLLHLMSAIPVTNNLHQIISFYGSAQAIAKVLAMVCGSNGTYPLLAPFLIILSVHVCMSVMITLGKSVCQKGRKS